MSLTRLSRIEAAIEAFHREEYKARDIALAGAFVAIAGNDEVRIERGSSAPELPHHIGESALKADF